MKTPFTFGRITIDKDFTDRVKETERLRLNFMSHTNTILVSPRRWGKSSLVYKASDLVQKKDKTIRFCFIDLNNVRTEEQFYKYLATEVLKVSSGKIQKIINNTKRFLGQFLPVVSVSPSPESNFQLSLNWNMVKKEPAEIIDLPERIAEDIKLHYIICIDEFQNISEFEDPEAFQKMLRARWQNHQHVSYCLYGSKRHMLMDVFDSPSMPFYKFGDIVFLEKITKDEWIAFIKGRFVDTGKNIDDHTAGLIAVLTDCHSYYVQQLAQQSWLRSAKSCTVKIVEEAFEDLVLQLSMPFQVLTDSLNKSQINFLKAVVNKVEHLSSKSTISEYQLGTSAGVLKIKKSLIDKELVDFQNDSLTFLDPLYKYWLKKYFYKI
jgi:uncharacterized protein